MRARCLIAASARRRSPCPSNFHPFRTPGPPSPSSPGSLLPRSRAFHQAGLADQPATTIQPTTTPVTTPEHLPSPRHPRLKDAKPFSDFLTDTFNRQHTYLRISVTERCNLRCLYCMPSEGVPLSPPAHLLTTPEIVLLSSVFVSQGVTKIRLTGGEPTVRRDILPLMHQIGELRSKGLRELCITTNGISLHRKLDAMVEAGLTGVNMSLDTLDPFQFQIMTRRKGLDAVLRSMDRILDMNAGGADVKLKVNCVVMRGVNDAEIPAFVEMTRHKDLEVRFIEYMPFDGNKWSEGKMLPYKEMLDRIRVAHPTIEQVPGHKTDTSKTWRVPGFAGRVGFITSMTSNFCGGCNRLRITSDGNLKVCLFGNAEVSLRDVVRRLNQGDPIEEEALQAIRQLSVDRAQAGRGDGVDVLAKHEEELLDIIGAAVKRKKAKHAGIGQLEHMKNRPMILIGSEPTTSLPTGHPRVARALAPSAPRPPWTSSRLHPLMFAQGPQASHLRLFSTTPRRRDIDTAEDSPPQPQPKLTHVSDSGSAHMVSISSKTPTSRIATAACRVTFSTPTPLALIRQNAMKKGDVLGVARVAGIMASKRTPDLIPLCHPIPISHVSVDLSLDEEALAVEIRATVTCDGKTGVEMEALTAASTAALTIYDMCKAVDKGMVIGGLRVVLKDGGKSGRWEMP